MTTNSESFERRFEKLRAQLYAEKIWTPSTVKGCTPSEIAMIEEKYKLRLPRSYVLMMTEVGWNAGRFSILGEYEFDLNVAKSRLTLERQYAADEGRLNQLEELLSPNGFVFLHRLGDYHLYFHCDGNDDPVIRYYFSSDFRNGLAYDSLLDMLSGLADYCRSLKYW